MPLFIASSASSLSLQNNFCLLPILYRRGGERIGQPMKSSQLLWSGFSFTTNRPKTTNNAGITKKLKIIIYTQQLPHIVYVLYIAPRIIIYTNHELALYRLIARPNAEFVFSSSPGFVDHQPQCVQHDLLRTTNQGNYYVLLHEEAYWGALELLLRVY